ncbi:hypothetical protein DAPPUDRAFT_325271 [Daphnia pulex]|uniref:DDE Tnp4 domain-containing protein n=1 Tax=Daphnia pulex TaxID=6669 RepID=E9H483_DAPPU|nr:hypothetical protein DAPPUDRAFT_325271 [Daphnia pulex]|eukprot:EFX73468.1 hypothetical protein DAPPUDRAFT_325271 [Daphnia pulex]
MSDFSKSPNWFALPFSSTPAGISTHARFLKSFTFAPSETGKQNFEYDARVFRNSSLSRAIGPKLIGTDNHLIADPAYKLLAQVLTPFRNRGQLEQHKLELNRVLKSDRHIVERAFGLLKMKWGRLN